MAWIELHQAVWTHRKTFELAALLDLDETYAAAHVIRLWTWALDNAPDGDVRRMSARAIAFGAGWRGDSDAFVQALIDSGWLDEGMQIHDWQEYAGRLIERRLQDAERKRALRSRPQDVRRTADAVRRTVPNRTGPDTTRPDTTVTSPQPPPLAEGESPPAPRKRGERPGRRGGFAAGSEQPSNPTVDGGEAGASLAPASDRDRATWERASHELASAMNGPNWETYIAPLAPVGRAADGGMHLRAPPTLPVQQVKRFRAHIAKALADAGDPEPNRVVIVQARPGQE